MTTAKTKINKVNYKFGTKTKHTTKKNITFDFGWKFIKKVENTFKKKHSKEKQQITELSLLDQSYNNLYDYQQDAVNLVKHMILTNRVKEIFEGKGKIILPTGAGKTKIMEHLIGMFYDMMNKNNFCFATYCHRLILSNELLERHIKAAINFGLKKLSVVIVSSNNLKLFTKKLHNHNEKFNIELFDGGKSTLRYEGEEDVSIRLFRFSDYRTDINRFINAEFKNGHNVMFAVLYHSMINLKNSGIHFDFAFYDEAHMLTRQGWYDQLPEIIKLSNINLFFTATPSNDKEDFDMNNEEIFGEEIIFRKPVDLVETKHITPLKNIIFDLYNEDDKKIEYNPSQKKNNILNAIKSIFMAHRNHIKHDSERIINGETQYENTSLFISVPGNNYLGDLKKPTTKEGRNFRAFLRNMKVNVYMISTLYKGNIFYFDPKKHEQDRIDLELESWEGFDKETFIEVLNYNLSEYKEDAIIINIDMLIEGIDLPNINGMIYFKDFTNISKLIQFLGRGLRRLPIDRPLINDDTVQWYEEEKFVKPCAYNYIPICMCDSTDIKMLEKHIQMYVEAYGDIKFNSFYHEHVEGEDDGEDENPIKDNITNVSEQIKSNVKKYSENIITLFKVRNKKEEQINIVKNFIHQAFEETHDINIADKWKEYCEHIGIEKFVEYILTNF